jgi:hypothetical protein
MIKILRGVSHTEFAENTGFLFLFYNLIANKKLCALRELCVKQQDLETHVNPKKVRFIDRKRPALIAVNKRRGIRPRCKTRFGIDTSVI